MKLVIAITTLTWMIVASMHSIAAAQTPEQMQKFQSLMTTLQQQMADGENAAAASTIAETEKMAAALMGEANPDVIRMSVQRAVLLRNAGELDDAMRAARSARRKAIKHLPAEHPVLASALSAIGSIHRLQGEFEDAEEQYRTAIKMLKSQGQSGQRDLAEVTLNLADVLGEQGDLSEALEASSAGLKMIEKIDGPDSAQYATATNNHGQLLSHLGQMDDAEKTLTKSLALHKKIYGDQHFEYATSLVNLALLNAARGNSELAVAQNREALDILIKQVNADHPSLAQVQGNLGQLLNELGQHEEAKTLLEASLATRLKIAGADHPATALTKYNLGATLMDLQQTDAARQLLLESAEGLEAAHGRDHRLPATAFSWLGMLETKAGDAEQAIEHFDEAREIANAAVWKVLPTLRSSDEQQKLMRRTFDWTLYASLTMADRIPDNPKVLTSAAQWLANGKGIAETALAAARSESPVPELKSVSLEEVRTAIPMDAVLIDIIRQDIFDLDATSYAERLGDPYYVAFITPHNGPVQRIRLGGAVAIDQLVEEARQSIADAGGNDGTINAEGEIEATNETTAMLQALADKVWEPIGAALGDDVRRIIISPDGALWLVPWNALPVAGKINDQSKYLIQQYAISTTPSGRALVEMSGRADGAGQPANKSTPAVFANPDFDQSRDAKRAEYLKLFRKAAPATPSTRAATFASQSPNVAALPGTELESAAIMPNLMKWLGTEKVFAFKGSSAMESVVKQLVRPRTVVFATHGFFLAEDDSATRSVDPLTRCGLLLSGCNDPASAIGNDDGVLTGVEITAIDFRSTELVVLSACETGIGKVENGNGVAGLRRAFHLAGANSVASTLWQIPDLDTAQLMNDFFIALADGEPKDDALRTAQLKRIAAREKTSGAAHPFFWAGFTISGR